MAKYRIKGYDVWGALTGTPTQIYKLYRKDCWFCGWSYVQSFRSLDEAEKFMRGYLIHGSHEISQVHYNANGVEIFEF